MPPAPVLFKAPHPLPAAAAQVVVQTAAGVPVGKIQQTDTFGREFAVEVGAGADVGAVFSIASALISSGGTAFPTGAWHSHFI